MEQKLRLNRKQAHQVTIAAWCSQTVDVVLHSMKCRLAKACSSVLACSASNWPVAWLKYVHGGRLADSRTIGQTTVLEGVVRTSVRHGIARTAGDITPHRLLVLGLGSAMKRFIPPPMLPPPHINRTKSSPCFVGFSHRHSQLYSLVITHIVLSYSQMWIATRGRSTWLFATQNIWRQELCCCRPTCLEQPPSTLAGRGHYLQQFHEWT